MALYVVSYDLHKVRIYQPLIIALRAVGAVEALESFWLIEVNQDVIALREAVASYLDSDDSVVVIEIKPGSNWATQIAKPMTVEWLRANVAP